MARTHVAYAQLCAFLKYAAVAAKVLLSYTASFTCFVLISFELLVAHSLEPLQSVRFRPDRRATFNVMFVSF